MAIDDSTRAATGPTEPTRHHAASADAGNDRPEMRTNTPPADKTTEGATLKTRSDAGQSDSAYPNSDHPKLGDPTSTAKDRTCRPDAVGAGGASHAASVEETTWAGGEREPSPPPDHAKRHLVAGVEEPKRKSSPVIHAT